MFSNQVQQAGCGTQATPLNRSDQSNSVEPLMKRLGQQLMYNNNELADLFRRVSNFADRCLGPTPTAAVKEENKEPYGLHQEIALQVKVGNDLINALRSAVERIETLA